MCGVYVSMTCMLLKIEDNRKNKLASYKHDVCVTVHYFGTTM